MNFKTSLSFAKEMDENDPLKDFRKQFIFPSFHKNQIRYFTGNSLGLQPITTREIIGEELDDWAHFGVDGHFESRRPWYSYHEQLTKMASEIVGAKEIETVITHSLTTNIHLLMVSFYQPKGEEEKFCVKRKHFLAISMQSSPN